MKIGQIGQSRPPAQITSKITGFFLYYLIVLEESKGFVIWITGISGAGKSTLMKMLCENLTNNGLNPICLDGDDLRKIFSKTENFYSYSERLELAYIYSKLCAYLSDQGFIVLIATIALFNEIHIHNRNTIKNYSEILIDTNISEVEANLEKSIYTDLNIESQIAGLDFSVELPPCPEYKIKRNIQDFKLIAEIISTKLQKGTK